MRLRIITGSRRPHRQAERRNQRAQHRHEEGHTPPAHTNDTPSRRRLAGRNLEHADLLNRTTGAAKRPGRSTPREQRKPILHPRPRAAPGPRNAARCEAWLRSGPERLRPPGSTVPISRRRRSPHPTSARHRTPHAMSVALASPTPLETRSPRHGHTGTGTGTQLHLPMRRPPVYAIQAPARRSSPVLPAVHTCTPHQGVPLCAGVVALRIVSRIGDRDGTGRVGMCPVPDCRISIAIRGTAALGERAVTGGWFGVWCDYAV